MASGSTAEQIDRELAGAALRKRQAGERPTKLELAALRRVEKAGEERRRWEYYASVPKKHWRQLSGRQDKVLNEQAARYGIPVGGPVVDLGAVARWIHHLLATKGRQLTAPEGLDPLLEGASQTLKDAYIREQIKEKGERAKLAKLDRLERERALLPREQVHEALVRMATILRGAGDRLQQQFGAEALAILDEALDDVGRETARVEERHSSAE